MHSTAPVLRSVTGVISQSPSKIPHLRFHITQRRAQSVRIKKDGVKQLRREQRCQSTVAHTGDVDRSATGFPPKPTVMNHIESQIAAEEKASDTAFPSKRKLEQLLKYSNLFEILQGGIPDRILSALMSDALGTPFIKSAPDHLFNKALLALNPEYFIAPYRDAHRHMRTTTGKSPLETFKSIDERLSTFAAYLDRMVAVRRENGKKLDVEACRHLLKWAGSMGDERLARSLLHDVMPQDGVQADLEAYNYYCQALVWSNAYSTAAKYHLRILPRSLEIRGSAYPPKNLVGHKTSNPKKGIKGVREQVLDVFKLCMDTKQPANEMTFVNLMIAMGREADLDGVNSILRSVWNIDVNLLGAYDEEEIESPTFYEEDHHLRPTEELLFAMVHIFGSNNDVRTAWLLMDFISRNYNLPIPEHVWTHLFEWTHLLSLRRSERQRKQGYAVGKIPHETFTQMYLTMMDEPHSVQPSMIAHYLLSRSWRDKRHLDNAVSHIQKLEDQVHGQHTTLKRTQELVMQFVEDAIQSGRPNAFATFEFYQMRRKFAIDFLGLQSGLQLLTHAVEMNLLRETDWAGSGKLTEWERRALPWYVKKFEPYLPTLLRYQTRTGNVELYCGNTRNAALFRRFKLDYKAATYIYNAFDTEDQVKLNMRMASLFDVIRSARQYCFRCETSAHSHSKCPEKTADEAGVGDETVPAQKSGESDVEDVLVLSRTALSKANILEDDPTLLQDLSAVRHKRSSSQQTAPVLPFV